MLINDFPVFLVFFLIALIAFFAASETALFNLSKFHLRQIKQRFPELYAKIRFFIERPAALVSTILLGSELSNLALSKLLSNYYESTKLSPWLIALFSVITVTPLVIFFGEITPKILAAKTNPQATQILTPPLWIFYKISLPIRFFFEQAAILITRALHLRKQEISEIKKDDLRFLLEDSKRKGAIHSIEKGLIENIFDIDEETAGDIATPIAECFSVEITETPLQVIEKINLRFYARIPVYQSNPENIVGILYTKDLLNYIKRAETSMTVRDLMKGPLHIDYDTKVDVLFRRLRQMKRHIAIITKENKAIGIVTMDDIVDEIFGVLWEKSP